MRLYRFTLLARVLENKKVKKKLKVIRTCKWKEK